MKRVNPNDVVEAYKATGLIPIRKAWTTTDDRGACAIDTLARHIADCTGEAWASENLDENYIRGFIDAWDADSPVILNETGHCKEQLIGYWDAILCRDAVEKAFTSVSEYTPEASS